MFSFQSLHKVHLKLCWEFEVRNYFGSLESLLVRAFTDIQRDYSPKYWMGIIQNLYLKWDTNVWQLDSVYIIDMSLAPRDGVWYHGFWKNGSKFSLCKIFKRVHWVFYFLLNWKLNLNEFFFPFKGENKLIYKNRKKIYHTHFPLENKVEMVGTRE